MTHKITKEKNSKVELEVTIAAADFAKLWDKAFKAVQAEIEISGFRKGMAPEDAVIAKYGQSAILEEMANLAINESYPKIMIEEHTKNNIKPIAEPHIHVVKLEKDADFVYHAHVAVYPEFTMPDYRKISAASVKEAAAKIGEEKEAKTEDEQVAEIMEKLDEKVKTETLDIENKIKENLKLEKEMMSKSKIRSIILENIITSIQGSDAEKAKEMWPEGFTEKDKAQIIILEIARAEKIEVTKEEIEAEMMRVMMYMNPEEINKNNIDEARIKNYAEQIVINEKVLAILEK